MSLLADDHDQSVGLLACLCSVPGDDHMHWLDGRLVVDTVVDIESPKGDRYLQSPPPPPRRHDDHISFAREKGFKVHSFHESVNRFEHRIQASSRENLFNSMSTTRS